MPYTQLFDDTNNLFDPVIFDCVKKHTTTLKEEQTLFDIDVFDSAIFDTDPGGFVNVSDAISRELEVFRTITGIAVDVDDDLSRELEVFRSLSDTATVSADALTRLLV